MDVVAKNLLISLVLDDLTSVPAAEPPAACSLLFDGEFGAEQVSVCGYGNVLTAIAFLTGLASEELSKRELATHAEHFPVLIAIRAVKRA